MGGGYYGDISTMCQVFHICGNDGNGGLTKYSFLCPNGTIFQQQYFVCDWWFNVDCSLTESLYSLNDIVAEEQNSFSSSNTEDDYLGGQSGGRRALRGSASEDDEVQADYEGNRRNARDV